MHSGPPTRFDLVPVDAQERSAPRTWRRLITAEPPEIFVGFGRPILAPAAGRVALVHDGELDHEARRSQLALMPRQRPGRPWPRRSRSRRRVPARPPDDAWPRSRRTPPTHGRTTGGWPPAGRPGPLCARPERA